MDKRSILIFLLLCLHQSIFASEVDLYQAEVPVASRSVQDRQAALKKALAKIFIKINGSESILQHPQIRSSLNKAPRWASRFQYFKPDSEQSESEWIQVTFSAEPLKKLFRQNSLGWWPSQRNDLMLWIMEQNNGTVQFISDNYPAVLNQINQLASDRGIPVVLPLMDLDDRLALPLRELWGGFFDSLTQANARYGLDDWVIARINQDRNPVQIRWTASINQKLYSWQSQGKDGQQLLTQGLQLLAEKISSTQKVALVGQQDEMLMIQVEAVQDFASLQAVETYLLSLPWCDEAEIIQIKSDTLQLALRLSTTFEDFDQALSKQNHLIRLTENEPPAHIMARYQWQK